jgi:hypothetical protein
MSFDKRRSHGWQASGSYTWSRADGLQPSSGTSAGGAQVGTVGAPPVAFSPPVTFDRDPNDLTNARGRLPNDRPHMARVVGAVDVPGTGITVAANLQYSSGKPWAQTTIVNTTTGQGPLRILLEPRGTRRLSSQMPLDLRVSKTIAVRGVRLDLLLDVLNALNDTAGEGLATDNVVSLPGGVVQPTVFMDPRRAMLGIRLRVGQ